MFSILCMHFFIAYQARITLQNWSYRCYSTFLGYWIKFLLILFEEHPFIIIKLFNLQGSLGAGGIHWCTNKNIKFINGQVPITVNFILYRKLTFLVSGTYWLKDQVVTLAADDGVVSIFHAKTLLKRRVNAVNLNKSWNSITLGGYPSIKMNSNSNKNTLKRHYNVSWKW